MKCLQSIVILFASFIIIVQSETIIDLLKDFTALLMISEGDNIMFNLALLGFMGGDLSIKAADILNARFEYNSIHEGDEDSVGEIETDTKGASARDMCNEHNHLALVFGILYFGMLTGWAYFVYGQFSGIFGTLKYPLCNVPRPFRIGDGVCHESKPYNTVECNWDGEDCIVDDFPECHADPDKVGNGVCDNYYPYNTAQCGYDGSDCLKAVAGKPGCFVLYPEKIGDKVCDRGNNYTECEYDGGDCLPKRVDGYPECFVLYPDEIDNGNCTDYYPYNTEKCGYDGGDCPVPTPVDGYPGCNVSYPEMIDNGDCYWQLPYNSPECKRDGGDCEEISRFPECYGMPQEYIGDGICDEYYLPVAGTPECGYDDGDCPIP